MTEEQAAAPTSAYVPEEEASMKGSTATMSTTSPSNRLSTVSQMYDRSNKGYLDNTELTLRKMDTDNQGTLTDDKVYAIMEELQSEQKKSLSLKRAVIALSCFAVLLALANIGTSFAAATLAKDTTADPASGALLNKVTGAVVGVDERKVVYSVTVVSASERRRRHMQGEVVDLVEGAAEDSFEVSKTNADAIMKSICSTWPGMDQWQGGSFFCGLSGTAMVEHCEDNYQTALKYNMKPRLTDGGGAITFRLEGERNGYNVGNVEIHCNLGNPEESCTVSGLTCSTLCNVCTSGGGWRYWLCGEEEKCGCFPDNAVSCVAADADFVCVASCYTPSTTSI